MSKSRSLLTVKGPAITAGKRRLAPFLGEKPGREIFNREGEKVE
jgi:hypothetical protein